MTYQSTAEQAPFSAWIREQADRNDMVGDLARDYLTGHQTGMHADDFRTAGQFKHAVLDVVGGDAWKPAYRAAKAEFKAAQKGA